MTVQTTSDELVGMFLENLTLAEEVRRYGILQALQLQNEKYRKALGWTKRSLWERLFGV